MGGYSGRRSCFEREREQVSAFLFPKAIAEGSEGLYKGDRIQLADLLGHGSVDTTRIYLQKSYDEQQRDFNKNVTW